MQQKKKFYAHTDFNKRIDQHIPCEHFVDEDSQRPPVDGLVVAFVLDNLWRQILRSTTQRPRSALTKTFGRMTTAVVYVRCTIIQTDERTDRQTGIWTARRTDGRRDRRQADRHTERRTERPAYRQADRQTYGRTSPE